VGVPLPSKKDAAKTMIRGTTKSTYNNDITVTVWKDNQPVFMMSNYTGPDPPGKDIDN